MLTVPARTGGITGLFLAAIAIGSLLGTVAPDRGEAVGAVTDPLILLLVGSLFLTLRVERPTGLRPVPRTVLLAVGMNFLIVPLVALALTAALPGEALRLGVLIYCLAPCTDWFLGFTRLSGGDTTTGAALIPVQMTLQLALYPLWLALFAGERVTTTGADAGPTLLTWFVLPAVTGLAVRLLMRVGLPARVREPTLAAVDLAVPAIIAAVILSIFAGQVGTIRADPGSFVRVLAVVFVFFVVIYALGEGLCWALRLGHPEHALLTMTTSARNAPLMLALTTIALPDQPVVHASIILGMLIEFPHLTVITHLLRSRHPAPVGPPRGEPAAVLRQPIRDRS